MTLQEQSYSADQFTDWHHVSQHLLQASYKLIGLLICILAMQCISGCADSSKWLAPEPSAHFSSAAALKLPNDLAGNLTLHCLATQTVKYLDVEGKKHKANQCIYVGIEANGVFGTDYSDPKILDELVNSLLSISDMNCSNFLARAFANRSSWDFEKTFFQDLATGAAAGTATVLAPAAAGLSGANLLIGKSVDSLTSTYFANQSFQAMEAAIKGQRAQLRAIISTRQDNNDVGSGKPNYAPYSVQNALSDVRGYDDSCSIREGLAQLSTVASQTQTAQTQINNAVNVAAQGQKGTALQTAATAIAAANTPTVPQVPVTPPPVGQK